jgi:hypothetical protein
MVDRAGLGGPHAFDPEHAAEMVEVAIVLQHARTALGGHGGDQVAGGARYSHL